MLHMPGDGPLLDDMLLEGVHGSHHQAVLDYVKTQRGLLLQYISGSLSVPLKRQGQRLQEHTLKIQPQYAWAIAEGRKTVEARVWSGTAAKVNVGALAGKRESLCGEGPMV